LLYLPLEQVDASKVAVRVLRPSSSSSSSFQMQRRLALELAKSGSPLPLEYRQRDSACKGGLADE